VFFLYLGRTHSATARASAWKSATCETCGHHYGYGVTREATGSGHSPYFLDESGAKDRAIGSARESVATFLQNAVEAVPCPKCGSYQREMRHLLPQPPGPRRLWLHLLGWSVIAVAILAWRELPASVMHPDLTRVLAVILIVAAVFALTLAGPLFRRRQPKTGDRQ
jgi:hypothetical protein